MLSSSGLLDPEQYETVDYDRHRGLKLSKLPAGEKDTLSPWQVGRLNHKERRIELDKIERLDRPTLAQTDRTGRFRSIFDMESLKTMVHKPIKNISSRVDSKWQNWQTLNKEEQKPERKESPRRKLSLPKPLKARVLELETEEILPVPINPKKFRSPGKLSCKRHLVQHINYREIEDSMFRKPMTANRFDLLCRKLENKVFSGEQASTTDKVRVINFPINEQNAAPATEPVSDKPTTVGLREHRLRHTFTNTFYLRNKVSRDKRQSDSSLDCPLP